MVRNKFSNFKIAELPEQDFKTLESLYGVSFGALEKEYSVNELLFELSNFIDEETIKNFELRVKEKQELSEWGVTPDPSISKLILNYRNKELNLVNRQIEEYLWRKAGQLTEEEIERFWNLYSFKNEKTVRGQALLKLDKANFLEFLNEANKHDDRLKFIASWYRKKEADNFTRGYLKSEFSKSDKMQQENYQEGLNKKAIKALEEFAEMPWDNITSGALVQFIRKFRAGVALNEPNQDKLLQLRGILIHPRLHPKDKLELQTILRHYKIEPIPETNEASLSQKPIKLFGDKLDEELSLEDMQQKLKNAKADYLNSLVSKAEKVTRV